MGTLSNSSSSYATGINDSGKVVGYADGINSHAFLYSNGDMIGIGIPAGESWSQANGINNENQIVGVAGNSSGTTHAFLYQNGSTVDLNTLTSGSGWTLQEATAINANGQIVGSGINPSGQTHAFLLTPTIPTVQATTTPSAPETAHPVSGQLVVFDANPKDASYGTFVAASNTPGTIGYVDPNNPTDILTHGYASSDALWAGSAGFAEALAKQQPTTNIVAWNWSGEAKWDGNWVDWIPDLTAADLATQNQGQDLASSLLSLLGTNYSGSLHFVGHSLGTMVNAKAIDTITQADHSVTVQDTLFDDGELANPITTAITSIDQLRLYVARFSSMPQDTSNISIDNYLSAFGGVHQGAVNVVLQQAIAEFPDIVAMHGYPVQWYQSTMGLNNVTTPQLQGMGFQFDGAQAQPGVYPFNFLQTVAPGDRYSLTPMTYDEASHYGGIKTIPSESYNYLTSVTIADITGAAQVAGGALVNVVNFLPPDSLNNDTPALGPQFILPKFASTSEGPLTANTAAVAATSNNTTAAMSYVFVPIKVPTGAQMMTLDYVMHGLSATDLLSVGINDTPLFALESQFVTPDSITNTGYLDVSQWAGTDVQLFIGLIPGDNQNLGGTITVDNIAFEAVPEPSTYLLMLGTLAILAARRRRVLD